MRHRIVLTRFNNNNTTFRCHRVSVFVLLQIILIYCSQVTLAFRFCYQGTWHQIGMSTKCSLGIAFRQPVPLYCAYENFQNEISKASFYSDVCTPPYKMDDFQGYNPQEAENLAHNLAEIQVVWYHEEGNSDVNTTKESPDVVDLNECIETCGALIEQSHSDSSESEELNVADSSETFKIKEQTIRLGDYLYDITFNANYTIDLDYRIVDILKRSFEVLKRACPDPFIPVEFNSRVLNGFLFLLSDSGTGSLYDITDEEYQDIKDSLEDCKNQKPSFQLDGTICSSKASVDTIVTIDEDGDRMGRPWKDTKEKEADLYRYDLFIDSTWKVIDIIHAVCFVHFQPNSNMHHRYQTAMEYLFTPQIQTRWRNPTQLINNEAWGSFLLVDIRSTLQNLYACERASYLDTPFAMKLDRPFERHRAKRDLSTSEVSKQSSATLSRQKRSRRPARNYWEQYEAEGGIEVKLKDQIFCFKDEGNGKDGGRAEIFLNLQLEC